MPPEVETLSDLAGLLVVNPEKGNEGNSQLETHEAPETPKGGDEAPAEVDWENDAPAGNPEDGTSDDEQPESDGDEDAPEGDEQATEDEPLHEVTLNGETKKVTLKEALDGYQRLQDYTRKTEEVARQREAVAAELEAVRAHRTSYKQVLDALEARLVPANQEPTSEQWEQLKAEDATRYATEWADYQRRSEQRGQIEAERQRVTAEERVEQSKLLRAHVEGERAKLFAANPQWKGQDGKIDAKKVETEIKEIREYGAKTFGFSEAELNQAYDHRLIIAFRKAMLWDKAEVARTAAKEKLAAAPEVAARGSRVQPKSAVQARKQEAQKRFDKTGRVDDAVDLLLS